MDSLTRKALGIIGVVVLALLALGAVPSYLGTGEPYYLTATPTDADGPAVDANGIDDRRYPYLSEALAADDNRSSGYQTGPGEFKEWFTHSPFDEYDSLVQLDPNAVDGDADRVLIEYEGDRYYVEVGREGER
ncbi:hypothetical protein ACNS7O_05045 [Haloferacaceae archaeon DSL9]